MLINVYIIIETYCSCERYSDFGNSCGKCHSDGK